MSRKTYAVHYGNGHLSKWAILPLNYRSLATAKRAAGSRRLAAYQGVIIADSDGGEWVFRAPEDR